MFTSVSAEWNTESKFKIKSLKKFVSEEVPLYHAEVIHWQCTNSKFNPVLWKQKYKKYILPITFIGKGECKTLCRLTWIQLLSALRN